jgi:hypothetical protein
MAAAPTQQQIRDAIKNVMLGVADVGVVHTYERYSNSLDVLKVLYVSNGQLRGWYIRLLKTQRASPSRGRTAILHTWRIRGFMALDDAATSELTFDALIESLQEAFNAHETLDGLVGATSFPDQHVDGLQRDDSGPVMFAGVLCHSAVLTLNTLHNE